MNQKVKNVLVASFGSAPDMTHALSLCGDGDMGAGVRNLWSKGVDTGVGIGASVATVVIVGGQLIYRAVTHKQRTLDMAEAIGTAYNAGADAAKQQTSEVYAYSAETGERLVAAEG